MTFRNRTRMTAWLGLIAMWLLVLAPSVSRLLESARADEPVAILCSAVQPGPAHHAPRDRFDACGYCTLLAHHVAAPTLPPRVLAATLVLVAATVRVLSTRFKPLVVVPSGRTRGPPATPRFSL